MFDSIVLSLRTDQLVKCLVDVLKKREKKKHFPFVHSNVYLLSLVLSGSKCYIAAVIG